MVDKVSLAWSQFQSSTVEAVSNLFASELLTDVTLVCEDEIPIKAHRFVLCSNSQIFLKFLSFSDQTNPLIYLPSVSQQNMLSLLKFMYRGQVAVPQDSLESFLEVGNQLKVRGLLDIGMVEARPEPTASLPVPTTTVLPPSLASTDLMQSITMDLAVEDIFSELVKSEYVENGETAPTMQTQESNLFQCGKCEYRSYKHYNVKKHTQSIHDGVRYPCNMCNYKATEKGHLRKHQKKIHNNQNLNNFQAENLLSLL